MKHAMLLSCVLCLMLVNFSHADELSDLRAANAQLKAENQQLKQRITALEHSNQKIKKEVQQVQRKAQKVQQQKHAIYLKISEQTDGSKTIKSYSRQLPLTRGKLRHSSYQLTATITNNVASPITLTVFAGMSPGMFRKAKALNLEIDGKKLSLPVTNIHSQKRRAASGSRTKVKLYDETVTIELTAQQVSMIAQANQVIGTLGLAQLALGREDYNLFTVLAEAVGNKQ